MIIPIGIQVDVTQGLGHNNIYFMEDFRLLGHGFVPVYENLMY